VRETNAFTNDTPRARTSGTAAGRSTIESRHGTYALVLANENDRVIRAGRVGPFELLRGHYIYVGSAFGPGGLKARLAHHAKISPRPHWHIDYLRAHAHLVEVWYTHDSRRCEHLWARLLGSMRGARTPAVGFGASDCRCSSHLFFFGRRPSKTAFERRFRAASRGRATIHAADVGP
jgi:Uri superfamily endonuclease